MPFLTGELVAFFIFALLIIGGAIFMISFTKVVHMVVSLAFAFLSLGGLYVLLEAEFVAFVQILIYAGAISILMIFGIMLTKHSDEPQHEPRTAHEALTAVGCAVLFGILFFAIQKVDLTTAGTLNPGEDNTREIGMLLFTERVIPFELVSVLLTVAFIGAIVLARREGEQ
ncbi:NADH-quinone oxidoreductase subunit J [Paenibacillus thermotolerans]|uniref:NADH-quinone oxidoreductase subunit J n=1 Tax=Paenibacillus thermotolerans TaxID=3027807 RepID=UPI00236873FB|nr:MULTISPECIES: NADH-quinone oxidoreductase subunit J [unclassified Paenibacillus]